MAALHDRSLVLLLTALLGCFRGPPAGSEASPTAAPTLEVGDRAGALYPLDAVPRDPVLRLRLAPGPRPATPPPCLLLEGELGVAFARRLGAGRVPAAVAERALALSEQPRPDGLTLTPEASLAPGRLYTLLWLAADAPAAHVLRVSAGPTLGARLAESLPSSGARAVAPNLARALVRFDGEVVGDLALAVSLVDVDHGQPLGRSERIPCAALGLASGSCAQVVPDRMLEARRAYAIRIGAGLSSPTGAPIAPAEIPFETGGAVDHEPPTLAPTPCDPDEQALGAACARLRPGGFDLRGTLSEPAEVAVTAGAGRAAALSEGRSFALTGIPRAADDSALELRDAAGNARVLSLALPPLAPPGLRIDEVRLDPLGSEPAQEYVELLNSGAEPASLMGLTLSTDTGRPRPLLAAVALAPGERVLVVGPTFDVDDAADGELPPGIELVRLGGALSLANRGVRLLLRDASGALVAAARAGAPLLEGQCSAHRADAPPGAPLALDPSGGCTPGRATFEPP